MRQLWKARKGRIGPTPPAVHVTKKAGMTSTKSMRRTCKDMVAESLVIRILLFTMWERGDAGRWQSFEPAASLSNT